jgi:hypothetical protein
MAKTITTTMQFHLDMGVTSLATCWAIKRRDGTEIFLTDHDQDIVLADPVPFRNPYYRWMTNQTYVAAQGYERKAITSKAQATDTSELTAILNSSGVSAADIQAGKYDGARVYIFMVNWANLLYGIVKLPGSGIIGEVVLNPRSGTYEAEVRGLGHFFQNRYGNLYSPTCRVDWASPRCGVDESQYQQFGVIETVTSNRQFNAKTSSFPSTVVTGDILAAAWGFEGTPGNEPFTGWTGVVQEDGLGTGMWRGDDFLDPTPSQGTGSCMCPNDTPHSTDVEFEIASNIDGATGEIPDAGGAEPDRTKLDSGEYYLKVTVAIGNESADLDNLTQARLGVRFYDDDTPGVPLGPQVGVDRVCPIIRKENHPLPNDGTMTDFVRGFSIPPNAHWVSIRLIGIARPPNDECYIAFDDVRAEVVALTALAVGSDRDATPLSDWFDHGLLIMTSGDNAGVAREIESFNDAGDEFLLYFPLPFTPAVDDTFEVYPGCKKRWSEDCALKWDNAVNFQAEPFLPSQDEAFKTPDAK